MSADPPSFTAARTPQLRRRALIVGAIATAIIPINFGVLVISGERRFDVFIILTAAQLVLGIWAVVLSLKYRRAAGSGGLGMAIGFGLVGLGGPIELGLVILAIAASASTG